MASSAVVQQLNYRLPESIQTIKYILRIDPDLETKIFTGHINITFKLIEPMSYIPLHAKDLTVETTMVQQLSDSNEPVKSFTPKLTYVNEEFEYWITEFSSPLQAGKYSIELDFKGSMDKKILGLYYSSYLDEKRKIKR